MTAANPDVELLTEHFGYPPVSLLDEIINSINFLAERALASVETGLLNAPPQQIGFGKPPATSNTRSKRKRKHPDHPPPPEEEEEEQQQQDGGHELSPDEIEARAQAEIASGTHQLETLLCTSIDRNFDKFELYVMRNILCVRPEDRDWIRLGHYDGLNFDNLPPAAAASAAATAKAGQGSGESGDAMDVDSPAHAATASDVPTVGSVNNLRRRLQASQRLNTMLLAEKTRNDALLAELRSIVGGVRGALVPPPATVKTPTSGLSSEAVKPEEEQQERKEDADEGIPALAFLRDKGDLTQADATTPLTTTTAFALSQMQALRALSTSLSNIMPDLKTKGMGAEGQDTEVGAGVGRSWRRERVEYVESAARKHLERFRGLELGDNGEVRDGEWQGDGRRFASGEVGALESVVQMLDGGEEERDRGSDREEEETGNDAAQ